MTTTAELAARIAGRMAPHPLPDPRFGLDFDAFIPGFAEADEAAAYLLEHAPPPADALVHVTPDNSLQPLRARLLASGHPLLMPTYGLMRGFLRIDPAEGHGALHRSWLEGAEHYGDLVSLEELQAGPKVMAHYVGAAAVALNGVRFGMGHRYFDTEFALMVEAGITAADASVVVLVHPEQVHHAHLDAPDHEVRATLIAMPGDLVITGAATGPSVLAAEAIAPGLEKAAPVRQLLSARAWK
ncbi:5-formyltetrahydrofolate cyclo-ligase [Pelagovum pacificum]|uniref:5-formyltetrahydrofolate cyclo-ligase n=1 Tax=Pelagovum pacificum TaxID=2588711 RepID=A0A5C5G8K9_9RHOB|nr:5-formyltetrahydrofolate cyclo-ligase [Pelagovum pacificum]QQA41763.1 hypothetical protein I8N54_13200 [Pelagovum pacificum]TNY31036.1 hypothetical protein FHY64_18270 [Pelagovum pacificum]